MYAYVLVRKGRKEKKTPTKKEKEKKDKKKQEEKNKKQKTTKRRFAQAPGAIGWLRLQSSRTLAYPLSCSFHVGRACRASANISMLRSICSSEITRGGASRMMF